ncbi:MAG: TrmH family RNA methyltransferase [Ilumatobacteraceae bacterium]
MSDTHLAFSHPRVQRLRRLSARRSARVEDNAFIIEGATLIAEAIGANWRIESQFLAPGGIRVFGTESDVYQLADGVMERVATTTTPQPVIAIAERRVATLASLPEDGWIVVADRVSDPGNLGTIFRSAEAAGACAVVLTPDTVEAFNPKVVRASAGALFHVPVAEGVELGAVRDFGFRLVGTSSHDQPGTIDFTKADLSGRVAVVVGNEARGMSLDIAVDQWVTIPHVGRGESLNVAMAATLVCFEVAKQQAANQSGE